MQYEDIYDQSYNRVLHENIEGRDFFEAFYDRFVLFSEEARSKFIGVDMARQRKMLRRSFYGLLIFYASGQTDEYLKKIAIKHNQHHLNIPPHLYDIWLECLILTVGEYDRQYSDDVALSWRLVLAPGITYMKFKYDRIE